jgi:hypothetical protein
MARGSRPGERRGGRTVGTKNRATIERAAIAERVSNEAAMTGKPLAKERLGEFLELFIGYARHYQPVLPQMLARGAKPNKNQDEAKFEKWSMHAMEAAEALAKYQSPQFRAVAVVTQEQQRPNAYSTNARERLRKLIIDTIINADEPEQLDTVTPLITAPVNGKPN